MTRFPSIPTVWTFFQEAAPRMEAAMDRQSARLLIPLSGLSTPKYSTLSYTDTATCIFEQFIDHAHTPYGRLMAWNRHNHFPLAQRRRFRCLVTLDKQSSFM